MTRTRYYLLLFLTLSILTTLVINGCAPSALQPEAPSPEAETSDVTLSVTVNSENLRATANGTKIGTAKLNESFILIQRRGNWCNIQHPQFPECWIWAPSLGLSRINPMSVETLNAVSGDAAFDNLIQQTYGQPSQVEFLTPDLVWYRYLNILADGSTLFGTKRFKDLSLLIHKESKSILRTEITLPPFKGDAKGLLSQLGLPDRKSSSSNFDEVNFTSPEKNVSLLNMQRVKGDFTAYSSVTAHRFHPDSWKKNVSIEERQAKQGKKGMEIILTLLNMDSVTYAAPVADIFLSLGGKNMGEWKLGPVNGVLNPGEEKDFAFRIPSETGSLDLVNLNVAVELVSMIAISNE